MHRLANLLKLPGCQIAPAAAWNAADLKRTDARAPQPQHGVTDGLEHTPHDPVAALVNDDLYDRAVLLVAQRPYHARRDALTIKHNAPAYALQRIRRRMTVQIDLVLLLNLVARVHDAEGELAVIGEEQQAFAGAVQATHRFDALRNIDELHHRLAATLVGNGRDVTLGLVQDDVALALDPNRNPIDRHMLARRIDRRTQLGDDPAVNRHTSSDDHLLSLAARGDAGRGQHPLQPLPVRIARRWSRLLGRLAHARSLYLFIG